MPDVLTQEVGGETVLLDLNSECYFGLDELGTRIWQLIQEFGDLQKVYDSMLDEYDVDGKQLEKDLDRIVDKLAEAGLICVSEE
jgi:hypothetical protein